MSVVALVALGKAIVIGAAIGAVVGGIAAAISGGDIWGGILNGAIGGAVAGALTWGIGGVMGGFEAGATSAVDSSVAATAVAPEIEAGTELAATTTTSATTTTANAGFWSGLKEGMSSFGEELLTEGAKELVVGAVGGIGKNMLAEKSADKASDRRVSEYKTKKELDAEYASEIAAGGAEEVNHAALKDRETNKILLEGKEAINQIRAKGEEDRATRKTDFDEAQRLRDISAVSGTKLKTGTRSTRTESLTDIQNRLKDPVDTSVVPNVRYETEGSQNQTALEPVTQGA